MIAKAVALCLMLAPGLVRAADFADPDWPCIQRKAAQLSPGLMWPEPVPPQSVPQDASDLADLLALRRVDLDTAKLRIEAFAQAHPSADMALMGNIFLLTFDKLSRDRDRLVAGIGRYSRGQIALADKITAARDEMALLLDADAPDFDRIDALEEQIDWDERIYHDRARSLGYVCETPVLLEKRLYAVAQMLQAEASR
ncbi:MAG: hypothetical protein KDA50_13810 [Rhodobacteraceae bacterium]|nr:hypothetical protein [Paracoccaceae bacterium]